MRFSYTHVLLFLGCFGCGAVYPEVASPLRAPPPGYNLEPPPPADFYYVEFAGADIPLRTRDGRKWDSVGNAAPDPYAKLLVDEKEVILTPVQSDTLRPTWPDQERANYRIPSKAHVRVELWDSNPIYSHPICTKKVPRLDQREFSEEEEYLSIECENGGRIRLTVKPARGKFGLGLYYELRTGDAYVTRVIAQSPAGRGGLQQGDQIVRVQGQDVAKMEQGKLQSLINANASVGVKLTLKSEDGRVRDVTLKDGAVYPLVSDGIKL